MILYDKNGNKYRADKLSFVPKFKENHKGRQWLIINKKLDNSNIDFYYDKNFGKYYYFQYNKNHYKILKNTLDNIENFYILNPIRIGKNLNSKYEKFSEYLRLDNKSENTIKTYIQHIKSYSKWYEQSFGKQFEKIYKANILDYQSYLLNVKCQKPTTIKAKLIALIKYNHFLVNEGKQQDLIETKEILKIKIQSQGINPTNVTQQEIENFRQKILENETLRDYAIVTLLAYAGLRISETLSLKVKDINLETKEINVTGKGTKFRVVFMHNKVINALREYLKSTDMKNENEYLFSSQMNKKMHRSRINQIFNKHSDKITPHSLRHFFCTYLLENNFAIHEVANLAGHSTVAVTGIYANPTRQAMKSKINSLD